jgi:predicted dinucleotide-binding enzyme
VGQAVVIDAMNALFTKPEPYERTSAALMAGTGSQRVVKCFNWTGAENMLDPLYGDERADMLYCGDDPEAKAVAHQLALACGFRAIDAGGLSLEPTLESAALLWIKLSATLGRRFAFRILQR